MNLFFLVKKRNLNIYLFILLLYFLVKELLGTHEEMRGLRGQKSFSLRIKNIKVKQI